MDETYAEKAERLDRERQGHLRYAFNKRDRLQKEIDELNAYIAAEGRLYWKHRGFSVMPRIEKLRTAILNPS